MNMFASIYNIPGEHRFLFKTKHGKIETILTVPAEQKTGYAAIIGHPHPLHGGTMNNKVVTTLSRTFTSLGISNIRFNFRGVGESTGSYDAGIGECEDMLNLVRAYCSVLPETQFIFSGFSFGSYVAYQAATKYPHKLLISIAPSLANFPFTKDIGHIGPWIVVQGLKDEVVDAESVIQFFKALPKVHLISFADTGHFFHGRLVDLKNELIAAMQSIGIF